MRAKLSFIAGAATLFFIVLTGLALASPSLKTNRIIEDNGLSVWRVSDEALICYFTSYGDASGDMECFVRTAGNFTPNTSPLAIVPQTGNLNFVGPTQEQKKALDEQEARRKRSRERAALARERLHRLRDEAAQGRNKP